MSKEEVMGADEGIYRHIERVKGAEEGVIMSKNGQQGISRLNDGV